MGVDISMMIVDHENVNGEPIADLFEGRNSDFFANLRGVGEIENFPAHCGIPEDITTGPIFKMHENGDYFGFHYITVGEFIDWCYAYRPELDAGWTTRYGAWKYKTRGKVPELWHEYPEDAVKEDVVFIEVEDNEEPFTALKNRINEFYRNSTRSHRNDYIIYCFDC